MRIFAFVVFALFLGASPASAWREYLYLDQGVAIQFPAAPKAMKSIYNSTLAKGLASTTYSAEDDNVVYKLTVIDLTNRPDAGANFLNEAAYGLMREGDVLFTDFPRVYQDVKAIYGVTLVVDRMDGSRVRSSLYYNKGKLYMAAARNREPRWPVPYKGGRTAPLPSPQPRLEQTFWPFASLTLMS